MNMAGSDTANPSMGTWLDFKNCDEGNLYSMRFSDYHIGNPLIRSVHGGVTASLIEMSAKHTLEKSLENEDSTIELVSSSVDYLRITKDVDILARSQIVRISRRLAFIDVWCWQDEEKIPIARGTCTLRIMRHSGN